MTSEREPLTRNVDPPISYHHESSQYTEPIKNLRVLKLSEGVSPVDPPAEYGKIWRGISKSLENPSEYGDIDVSRGEDFVRERFGIEKKSYIAFSGGGSDEILERIITQLIKDPNASRSMLTVVGLTYPHAINFAGRYGSRMESIIETPLGANLDETLEKAIDARKKDPRRNIYTYAALPSTPAGDSATRELAVELFRVNADRGGEGIADEAFGDSLADSQSLISEVENNDHLIVLRSLSKGLALPAWRIGYVVMSESLGEKYDNIRRKPDLLPAQAMIVNRILDPKIVVPHLESARLRTKELKMRLMEGLVNIGIDILPTDPHVPILTVDGGEDMDNFWGMLTALNVETARGSSFVRTHSEMSDRYVRMTVPKTVADIDEVVRRIKMLVDKRIG